jgi:hypothetical protein
VKNFVLPTTFELSREGCAYSSGERVGLISWNEMITKRSLAQFYEELILRRVVAERSNALFNGTPASNCNMNRFARISMIHSAARPRPAVFSQTAITLHQLSAFLFRCFRPCSSRMGSAPFAPFPRVIRVPVMSSPPFALFARVVRAPVFG